MQMSRVICVMSAASITIEFHLNENVFAYASNQQLSSFQILLGKCLTALDMQSQGATKDIEHFGSFAELCVMKFQIFHIILHFFTFLLLHRAFNHTCCTCQTAWLSACLSVSLSDCLLFFRGVPSVRNLVCFQLNYFHTQKHTPEVKSNA